MASQAAGSRSKIPKRKPDSRSLKRKKWNDGLDQLGKKVQDLNPQTVDATLFSDLPLSTSTASGLKESNFVTLTPIQKKAIPFALQGRDILGAAKTGSGKTLAFLIPVLEKLYRQKWSELDGLGAMILSPTRELAVQIFKVLKKIGRFHRLSAGLVVGGESVKEEQKAIGRVQILVCTPGRILQHLDQTSTFVVDNLQVLVLDEADRIMDMGFQSSVDAILQHLPKERQTMLFSATQTKKVSYLERLSLREDREYISVDELSSSATPSTLQQHYMITPLAEKLNVLFSFLRATSTKKIIVFVSSGKQVRFIFESFRRLRIGMPLFHLHGRHKQAARLKTTALFTSANSACLLATDVVARGIDFPAVDWVIQLDCPEDADTYIHRVGRTARYEKKGEAVMFLDPSEVQGILQRLAQKKVPIEKINSKQSKRENIQSQLQKMCFEDPEIKHLAQKAFITYAKSVHLQQDKEIFKIKEMDFDGYAESMGLAGAPKIKLLAGEDSKRLKNTPRALIDSSDDDEEENGLQKKKDEIRTKHDRMFERRNQDVLSNNYSKLILDTADTENGDKGGNDDENEFLAVKRIIPADGDELEEDDNSKSPSPVPKLRKISKRQAKLLTSKKHLVKLQGTGMKTLFTDDGESYQPYQTKDDTEFQAQGTATSQKRKFLEEETAKVQLADLDDKALAKSKRKEKKEKRKVREAMELGDSESDNEVPQLVSRNSDNDDEEEDPLALLASLPLDGKGVDERPQKKAKKWFEDDQEDEKTKGRGKPKRYDRAFAAQDHESETLEDLEALAAGLLD